MKAMNTSDVMRPCWISLRPINSRSAIAMAPMVSIERRADGLDAHAAQVGAEAGGRAAFLKRRISQSSVLNALTMRLPVTVSCRMFWISASLSWPLRVRVRTSRPMLRAEVIDHRNEQQQRPAQTAAQAMTMTTPTMKVKNCCRKFADARS